MVSAGDHVLVHQDHPRADLHAPGADERGEPGLGRGPDLEVVVEHRGLAVEQEPRVGVVALEEVEELVEEVHELDPVGLERGVPLTVPVGVRDDAHLHEECPASRSGYEPVRAGSDARERASGFPSVFRLQFVHTTAQVLEIASFLRLP